jgi:predicted nuclease of predicted toxin-antitoxin system
VKLLLDENLSRKLAVRLSELYPGLVHVAEFGLLARPDYEIWERARRDGFIIVSTDSDFEDSTIVSSVSETPLIRTKVSKSAK